jgi:hypothetical protein
MLQSHIFYNTYLELFNTEESDQRTIDDGSICPLASSTRQE